MFHPSLHELTLITENNNKTVSGILGPNKNGYLSHRNNYRQLSADSKTKNFKINSSFVTPDRPKIRDDKTGTYTLLFYPIKLSVIRYDTGIFQYGLELIILKSEIIKKCYLV